MKVLLLGCNGQLGSELQLTCPSTVVLSTCDFPKVDLCSSDSIRNCIQSASPDCLINSAAYTAVDKAEKESDTAFRINRDAVKEIASYCLSNHIYLVHISTDYVFNGNQNTPYKPDDEPDPQSVYGRSKLDGELAVKQILDNQALILRTAWLYAGHGQNFVKTMLRLMNEKESVSVIDDQIGTPTWARGLAKAVWRGIDNKLGGTFHWTDAGVSSWYDFAVAIQEEGLKMGLLKKEIPVLPISTRQYPTPAKRPVYSVLDTTRFRKNIDCKPVHWRKQLKKMLEELNT